MLNEHTKVVRNKSLLTSNIGGDLVMLSIDDGKYFGMNPIGRAIWMLLEKETTVSDLCLALTTRFDVSLDQCQSDVIQFLKKLADEHVIEICA